MVSPQSVKGAEPFEAKCEDMMPKACPAAGICTGLSIQSRQIVIIWKQYDGELSVLSEQVFRLCLYYSTITAGFQPVFLFLKIFLQI